VAGTGGGGWRAGARAQGDGRPSRAKQAFETRQPRGAGGALFPVSSQLPSCRLPGAGSQLPTPPRRTCLSSRLVLPLPRTADTQLQYMLWVPDASILRAPLRTPGKQVPVGPDTGQDGTGEARPRQRLRNQAFAPVVDTSGPGVRHGWRSPCPPSKRRRRRLSTMALHYWHWHATARRLCLCLPFAALFPTNGRLPPFTLPLLCSIIVHLAAIWQSTHYPCRATAPQSPPFRPP